MRSSFRPWEIQAAEEAAQAAREFDTALDIADQARVSFLAEYLTRTGRPPAGTLKAALSVPVHRRGRAADRRGPAATPGHPGW